MWGLPDSAIVGTVRRLTRASKKNNRGSAVKENKEIVLAQNWSAYNQDARSLEQLLAEAKRHAKEKEEVGKVREVV
jgi:hypothetical protein